MQSSVSNNLNAILGSKDPQLSAVLSQNSGHDVVNNAVNKDANRFDKLVAELIKKQTSAEYVDHGGGLQPGLPLDLQHIIQRSLQATAETRGNALPLGKQQAANLPLRLLNELQTLVPEQAKAISGLLAETTSTVETATDVKNSYSLYRNILESASNLAENENRFSRNNLTQNLLLNAQLNAQQSSITTQNMSVGDKVVNQTFADLMVSGTALDKINTQSLVRPTDVSLKALLSVSGNDTAIQSDSIRTDSHNLYTNTLNNTSEKLTLSLAIPLSNSAASQQSFGEKVMWMINQNIHSAEIKLNPPELGRLEIKISMQQQDQTNISFSSQNQQVREMIELALPRLREMLGDSGLNLSDVDISDKSFNAKDNREQFASNKQSDQQDTEVADMARLSEEADVIIEQQLFHNQDSARIDYYA